MENLANVCSSRGRYKQAETLRLGKLKVEKRIFGAEHPSSLLGIGRIVEDISKQGRFKEAEALFGQVMKVYKIFGAEHEKTLDSISSVANQCNRQGRYKEAETLKLQVLNVRRKVLGETHLDTLKSAHDLAETYKRQRRYKEAEAILVNLVKRRNSLLGKRNKETLSSLGDLAEAKSLNMEVLETCKLVFGELHPRSLQSMGCHALICQRQEDYKAGETLYSEVLDIKCMSNHILVYCSKNRWEHAEALEETEKVIELCKRVLGEEHPDTLKSARRLVRLHRKRKRYTEAESLGLSILGR
ncbi:hypothetical protein FPQ18DRAFT_367318 [Pyronema domesticum]|nr:hypothetical protein FPQ18DRAFT_367318 [Pyronema domesticum]